MTAEKLDLMAFGVLARRASVARSAGDASQAMDSYEQALSLWRGDPLADIDLLRAHPAVLGISHQRDSLVVEYADAAISGGEYSKILPHLRDLVSREPFNEAAQARLMIALAGSGQQAAALAIYDRVRLRLDAETGIRPGAELDRAGSGLAPADPPCRSGPG